MSKPVLTLEAHTPGPWKASRKSVFVSDIRDMTVASISERDEAIANARLIAAAPDLLRVAELLVSWLDEEEGAHKLCDAARAAISKATSPSRLRAIASPADERRQP